MPIIPADVTAKVTATVNDIWQHSCAAPMTHTLLVSAWQQQSRQDIGTWSAPLLQQSRPELSMISLYDKHEVSDKRPGLYDKPLQA